MKLVNENTWSWKLGHCSKLGARAVVMCTLHCPDSTANIASLIVKASGYRCPRHYRQGEKQSASGRGREQDKHYFRQYRPLVATDRRLSERLGID